MREAQKPDHVSLDTLVSHLKEGRFVIPDFQREFEWLPWDIQALMRSVFLDYFIGSLLLWKGKPENFSALACEAIYGYSGDPEPVHIVLDGQQRLTAMYYAFLAPDISAPNRANRFFFFIQVDRFMDGDHDEAFPYDWTQQSAKLLENRTLQYERHRFPLSVIGSGGWELGNWVQGYEKHWENRAAALESAGDQAAAEVARRHAENARAFGKHLREITGQYQVSYIELDRELELDKVCDIFTQINSRGVRLDVFDLFNALLRPKELKLKDMWHEAAPRLDFVETERMNVYILQVMSILRQTYCSPKYLYYLLPGQEKSVRGADGSLHKEVLVPSTGDFEQLWKASVDGIEKAIKLLQHPHEFGVISSQYLPYVSILPVFAALQMEARAGPANGQLDAQRKIRHWYWASVFTYRYSGSVESTAARDFLDVKSWFASDSDEPSAIAEFQSRFRSIELRRENKRGTSVYNGIFNLLVVRGARDWMSGDAPQVGDLDDHHIVPRAWGKEQAGIGGLIDSILNRTPLTSKTNRDLICDRLPNEYLPELIEASGEATVRAVLETHFISPLAFEILLRDPFTPQDFEDFLGERQRTLQDGIEDLLIKERLDLPPQLRELDERVEKTELGLRQMIADRLDGDPARLPPHVQQRIQERLQAAAKKNPALDLAYYGTLAGQLEYFDLRELQDTMTSKAQWPAFADAFKTKEGLDARFGQLAALRNGIRHSRAVDEITQMEGQAALLWFEKTLQL